MSYSVVAVLTVASLVGVMAGATIFYGFWLLFLSRVGRDVERAHWLAFAGCVVVVFAVLLVVVLS